MPLFRINNGIIEELVSMQSSNILEKEIEKILVDSKLKLLNGRELLIIGTQINTSSNKRMDILAIDPDGRLVVVELKRGMSPRDIISQILDYASWLDKISHKEIEKIYREKNQNKILSSEFKTFYVKELETSVGIIMYLVASDFPEEVYEKVKYLTKSGLSIICVGFDIFKENDNVTYLHTDMAGEIEESTEKREKVSVSPFKSQDLTYFKKLEKTLEERYGVWLDAFDFEKICPFKTWQDKEGSATANYLHFKFDSKSKLAIEFQIERTKDRVCLWFGILCRNGKNQMFKALIQQPHVLTLAEKAGMAINNDTGWGTCLLNTTSHGLINETDGTINEEITTKLVIDKLEQAKPLIEAIMKKSNIG